ncbi:MAG: ribonuclease H-like domain-containing protein [Dehalococcoidales bacterium]|nr:ribonuclease H-like domain-containing protein [Dehalococcoidales bacterium]
MYDAYLSIATTGLSLSHNYVTVVGVYKVSGISMSLVQLAGNRVTVGNLFEALDGVSNFYTYNGERFDIPFILNSVGIDLRNMADHHDLMYDCWRCNLCGDIKAVERQLGIPRQMSGINGYDAVLLWHRYLEYGDQESLAMLLAYNRENVVNLRYLRDSLAILPG